MKKGVSQLVVAMLLLILAVSLSTSFFMWGQDVLDFVGNVTETQIGEKIKEGEASFYITLIKDYTIEIKNAGETKLSGNKFSVYLNKSKGPAALSQPQLSPGEKANLTVSENLTNKNYMVVVTGEHNTRDEVNLTLYW